MKSDALHDSYRWCRHVARKSNSSFYRSFGLLRPDKERAMLALYTFARIVDDVGDQKSQVGSLGQLTSWHCWLDSLGAIEADCETIEQRHLKPAFRDMTQRYSVPVDLFHDLLRGIESDLQPNAEKKIWSDLEHYCYCVAGTIGLACVRIWGGDHDATLLAAKSCGIAFQLTNILRDIREDAMQGRIYFPEDDLRQFGVSRQAWLALKPDGDWQGLLRSYVERADANYQIGYEVGFSIDEDSQRMFSLMWESYKSLLEAIRKDLPAVFDRRIHLPAFAKLRLATWHFMTPLYMISRRFPVPQPTDRSK